jgi:DNA polymerase V
MKIMDTCELLIGTIEVPFYSSLVAAGQAAWADDSIDTYFSLDQSLVKHPKSVFCVKVSGESMLNAGISPGDVLVVDTKEEARDGRIIIASIDGDTTVKRLVRHGGKVFLVPANPKFSTIEILPEMSFRVLGVVTHVIREAL